MALRRPRRSSGRNPSAEGRLTLLDSSNTSGERPVAEDGLRSIDLRQSCVRSLTSELFLGSDLIHLATYFVPNRLAHPTGYKCLLRIIEFVLIPIGIHKNLVAG